MAKNQDELVASMKQGIEEKTGKSFDHWVQVVRDSGIEKHSEQIKLLKVDHSFTLGCANLVCQSAKGRLDAGEGELLEGQYAGKESLRPIYEQLIAVVKRFGKDVEIAPKKTSVALRCSKNFAVITPATKKRIDLGMNLKGHEGTERLKPENEGAMCTHKVGVTTLDDVDDELLKWLKDAYEVA